MSSDLEGQLSALQIERAELGEEVVIAVENLTELCDALVNVEGRTLVLRGRLGRHPGPGEHPARELVVELLEGRLQCLRPYIRNVSTASADVAAAALTGRQERP